jgi:hypothetical protein
MSDDPPVQLKPRLAISIDQAQAMVDRVAPRSRVLGIIELHGGEMSTIFEIALADAANCILKVYPPQLQWKMAKEVYIFKLLRNAGTTVPRTRASKIYLPDARRRVPDAVRPSSPSRLTA